jgi:hypothetical protein
MFSSVQCGDRDRHMSRQTGCDQHSLGFNGTECMLKRGEAVLGWELKFFLCLSQHLWIYFNPGYDLDIRRVAECVA